MDVLPFHAVHIDLLPTTSDDALSRLDAYRRLLTTDEHERMARFVFERDQRAFLLTRALVRTTLKAGSRCIATAATASFAAALVLALFQSYLYAPGNAATITAWVCAFAASGVAAARS